MNYLILFSSILISTNSFSQTTSEDSIWFEFAQSYRKVKVWTPEDFDSSKTYQTIYCLDASLLFNSIVSSVEIYSYPDIAVLPPTIVVGLYFDQRNDDMGIDWEKGTLNKNGLAYIDFIDSTLIPTIESRYSVSSYRSIVGHSNSSTFIQFFLWKSNPSFQGYLSMSEYWFDSDPEHFCNLEIPKEAPIDFVFVSGKNDAPFRYKSGLKHQDLMDSCSINNLNYNHIILEDADHITMVPQGIPLGLEKLYSSYTNSNESADSIFARLGDQSIIEYVDESIKMRATKYGVDANYSYEEIDLLYELFVLAKDSSNMRLATQRYAELFMDSSEFFYEAQCLEMMGAYESAERSYLKHLDYSPYKGIWSYKRIIWLYISKLNKPSEALKWCEKGYEKLHDSDILDLVVRIAKENEAIKLEARETLKRLKKTSPSNSQKEACELRIKSLKLL